MKPVDYFLLFDEGKDEFIQASEKNDLFLKLEAVKKMGSSASKIIARNYHVKLSVLFNKETKNKFFGHEAEMFNTWGKLIDMNAAFLVLLGEAYEKVSLSIIEAIDVIKLLKVCDAEQIATEEADALKKEIVKNELLQNVVKATYCIAKGMPAPYSHVVGIIRVFLKDSYFLKDEEITTNLN